MDNGTSAAFVARLQGRWRVARVSGLLPPMGVSKRIQGSEGATLLLGVPVGRFRLDGRRLVYRWWPVIDELEERADGDFDGVGFILGRKFCRFRLRRQPGGPLH